MKLILILICNLPVILSAEQYFEHKSDESFREFCARHSGEYESRQRNQLKGVDKCSITAPVATSDDEEAGLFCRMWMPYTVRLAKSQKEQTTRCVLESEHFCESSKWKLIWGRCYHMIMRGPSRRDHAEKVCKLENATIAHIANAELSRIWKAFYPLVPKIWINSDGIGNLALVYGIGAAIYGGRGSSIVEMPENAVAFALCERAPSFTAASYVSKLNALNEIYYHSEISENGLFFRSSNFYRRVYRRDIQIEFDRCENILKAIGHTWHKKQPVHVVDTRNMSRELRDTMVLAHLSGMLFAEGSDECLDGYKRMPRKLFLQFVRGEGGFEEWLIMRMSRWLRYAPTGQCYKQGGTALLHHNGLADTAVIDVSDATSAPMWCGAYIKRIETFVCDWGFEMYGRFASDTIVCHKAFNEKKTHSEAMKSCQDIGASLSGFESAQELWFLRGLSGYVVVHLGAKRAEQCRNAECTRDTIVEWQNGVASNADRTPVGKVITEPFAPNADCLMMEKYRSLVQLARCDTKAVYICQKPRTVTGWL